MTREKAHTFLLQLLPDKRLNFSEHEALRVAIDALHTGHWITTSAPYNSDNIVCSKCGFDSLARYSYCPACGAEMEGEE